MRGMEYIDKVYGQYQTFDDVDLSDPNARDSFDNSVIQVASSKGDKEGVLILVRNEAKVDLEGDMGVTALQEAARHGYFEIVKVLLEAGADPHKKNKFNFSASDYARISDFSEISDLIESFEKRDGGG